MLPPKYPEWLEDWIEHQKRIANIHDIKLGVIPPLSFVEKAVDEAWERNR